MKQVLCLSRLQKGVAMKFFVRSVLCLFLCTSFSVLDAAEKPSKKSSLKKLFGRHKGSRLSPITEQEDSPSNKDEGKHDKDPDAASAITTGRIDAVWGIPPSPRASSVVHANHGEEATGCNNRFTMKPTLQDFFSTLVNLLKPEDRVDYRRTFYWEAPSAETIGKMEVSMNKKERIENSKRCYAQRYLRGIVEAAFTCDARKENDYGKEMLEMRKKVERCRQEAQQETASVMISLEKEKAALHEHNNALQEQNNSLQAQNTTLSAEKTDLMTEKNGLAERIERDQRSLLTYRYALGAATVIAAVSLGIAGYAWSSSKPAQTTTA